MYPPTTEDIHKLIIHIFEHRDFDAFCKLYFGEWQPNFPPDSSLESKSGELIRFCENHKILANLLTYLQHQSIDTDMQVNLAGVGEPQDVLTGIGTTICNPRQVFISYTKVDSEFAHQLAVTLRNEDCA